MEHIYKIIFGSTLVIIFWEHFARLNKSFIKPSVPLNHLQHYIRIGFENCGYAFGHLSSFLLKLRFEELYLSITDLLLPPLKILISPLYGLHEYLKAVSEYKWPILIACGSGILIWLVLFMLSWIKKRYYPTQEPEIINENDEDSERSHDEN